MRGRDDRGPFDRGDRGPFDRGDRGSYDRGDRGSYDRGPYDRGDRSDRGGAFVPFRVTWGGKHGADPRRLLALVCRRGGITSDQVGTIHVGDRMSTVEVASPVAPGFAQLAKRPDARDPRIQIEPMGAGIAPPKRFSNNRYRGDAT